MAVSKLRSLLESKRGRTFLSVALFALLTLIVFRNYLHGGFLVGSDAMGPLADLEMMKADHSYFSSWRSFTSLGHLDFPSPSLSIIYYISMEVLGLDPSTVWKGLIVLFFWLAGFLMYVCTYRITGNYLAGLIGGLAYLFNQVFLSQVTEVHHFFIMGYALFPILFLLLYMALRKENRWGLVALPAFALLYGTIGAPHTIMITAIFLILFILTYAALEFRKSRADTMNAFVLGIVTVFLVVLPMVLMKYSGGGIASWDLHYTVDEAGIYSSYTIYHSFIMASSENTFVFGSPIGQWTFLGALWPLGLIVAVIVPIIALTSLKVTSRWLLLTSLFVPVLAFWIIASGPNPPYGQLFTLAFQNIPLMDSIRVYSRFHLLTGFAIALMIAVVIAHFEEIREKTTFSKGWLGRIKRWVFSDRKVLSCVIIFSLVFPSSFVLTGEIRAFDLPPLYTEPYQWLQEQQGDFRVLNLPYQQVYYTQEMERYDGYPSTMTLDVGMYSPLISYKPFAFGVETQDFWSYIGTALENREYGYKDLAGLLGGTASVKYFVAQVQTNPNQTQLFSSLNGAHQVVTFEGGSSILENQMWQPRIHSLGKVCLISGGRAIIPTVAGLGLVDPSKDGIVFLGQLDNESIRQQMFSLADMLIVPDGDVMELATEAGYWNEGEMVNLKDFGDVHTTDAESAWIVSSAAYTAGYTYQSAINTTGRNQISVTMGAQKDSNYDLLIRAIYGPDVGTLNITVDNVPVASVRPYASYSHPGWIRVGLSNLSQETSNHRITISNDGSGENSLEKLIFAPSTRVADVLNETGDLLQKYQEKVVYTFSGAQSSGWVPGTFFAWEGEAGSGISNSTTLLPRDFAGDDNFTKEINTTSVGTTHIASGANVTGQLLNEFAPDSSYIAKIQIGTANSMSGSCLLQIKDENGRNITSKSILFDGTQAEPIPLSFTMPNKSKAIQFKITNTGNTPLLFGQTIIANQNVTHPMLHLDLPIGGNYTLGIAAAEGSSIPSVTVDGVQRATYTDGELTNLDLNNISKGTHVMDIDTDRMYALFLSPSKMLFNASSPGISFERQSDTQYVVNTSSSGPMWLLLSESYHPLWVAKMDGKELLHVPVNSIVNAYFIPEGGNHTVTVEFQGQEIYTTMLVEMLAALVLCTAFLILLGSYRTRNWFRTKWSGKLGTRRK